MKQNPKDRMEKRFHYWSSSQSEAFNKDKLILYYNNAFVAVSHIRHVQTISCREPVVQMSSVFFMWFKVFLVALLCIQKSMIKKNPNHSSRLGTIYSLMLV